MYMTNHKRRIIGVAVGGVMAVAAATAVAQGFPTKLIRVVNPAAPGGNSDVFLDCCNRR